MKTKYPFILLIIILLLYLLNLLTIIYYTIIIIIFSLFGIYIAFKLNRNELMKCLNEINVLDNNWNQFSINSSFDSIDSKTTNLNENYFQTRTLISQNVDQLIEQIIDFCLRDFVFIWYKKLVINCDQTFETKLK